jgi:hypothetical protein
MAGPRNQECLLAGTCSSDSIVPRGQNSSDPEEISPLLIFAGKLVHPAASTAIISAGSMRGSHRIGIALAVTAQSPIL